MRLSALLTVVAALTLTGCPRQGPVDPVARDRKLLASCLTLDVAADVSGAVNEIVVLGLDEGVAVIDAQRCVDTFGAEAVAALEPEAVRALVDAGVDAGLQAARFGVETWGTCEDEARADAVIPALDAAVEQFVEALGTGTARIEIPWRAVDLGECPE